MPQVTWDEIAKSANAVFDIWTENRWEVQWAKRSWNILKNQNLTEYQHELERCAIVFRLMALAMIYSDFVYKAWREECNSYRISDITYNLVVEPFYAGQLAGVDLDINFGSDWKSVLAMKYREEVREALLKGFGGEAALFVALWRTYPQDHFASTADIVNDLTAEKLEAYEWLLEGCPAL